MENNKVKEIMKLDINPVIYYFFATTALAR